MTQIIGFPEEMRDKASDGGGGNALSAPFGLPTREAEDGRTYGALDLGTNNCRLLIARRQRDGFKVIDSFSRITRLGEGLGARGRFAPAAIDRTLAALTVCASRMERHGVSLSRCVATAACRLARDTTPFLERVRAETGLAVEVISADEEARLALAGCAPLLESRGVPTLLFDIGGGSTELTLVEVENTPAGPMPGAVRAMESLPLGVVTMAEAVGGGHLSARLHADIVTHVRERLRPFDITHGISDRAARGDLSLLGTSGTVTTVGAVALGLTRYDRARVDGLTLPIHAVKEVGARLLDMTPQARAAHPCIGRDRADLVLAGCAILEAILSTWPVPRVRVADRGIREGLLMTLMGARGPGDFTEVRDSDDPPLADDKILPPLADDLPQPPPSPESGVTP
ncbi:Ppx/GppA phosphatase family protein [Rhodospirillum rubrum]|uniref:Ppx/GppA phosphatase n=1 Tax=Rhodospirillum rubrum (strain ATCC 11170 / ATH 1.1.1 / DSM 467 / LMG 4362 / NCIMB 8255 / S1) TaxID=269796 RepID=Q2RXU4_RHORT|nr:Ppx/GppA phosphatase family protein [Rhodospirillum rubrum]ABC21051.1 Ppx/GppA phosphatase [Rhodospirillum rubrum ATCC 11170]AEO46719.1 Ppx/GppA phosphatase [Rhodospirillum rubrum F11]MBK5952595.1 exopolyphosphatase [Rhodospirillum rubrum]QXG80747.1 Ppx/GppA family phosphatase [Rhodospirillum rubrum]